MTHTGDTTGSTIVQRLDLWGGEPPLRATIAIEVGSCAAVRGDGASSA